MIFKVRTTFLSFAFCFLLNSSSFGQSISPPPPDETYMSTETDDCGGGFENADGSDPSPPPGLCLPIDDYLLPLFVAGLFLGAYKMQKLQKI